MFSELEASLKLDISDYLSGLTQASAATRAFGESVDGEFADLDDDLAAPEFQSDAAPWELQPRDEQGQFMSPDIDTSGFRRAVADGGELESRLGDIATRERQVETDATLLKRTVSGLSKTLAKVRGGTVRWANSLENVAKRTRKVITNSTLLKRTVSGVSRTLVKVRDGTTRWAASLKTVAQRTKRVVTNSTLLKRTVSGLSQTFIRIRGGAARLVGALKNVATRSLSAVKNTTLLRRSVSRLGGVATRSLAALRAVAGAIDEIGDESRGSVLGLSALGGAISRLSRKALAGIPFLSFYRSQVDEVGDEADESAFELGILGSAIVGLGGMALSALPSLGILKHFIDDTGDEATESARETGLLSLALGTLGVTAALAISPVAGLSLAMAGLSSSASVLAGVITLILIPALVALSLVLLPIAATLGVLALGAIALAGAFGLVIGAGILAWGKGFNKALKKSLTRTKDLIAAWGRKHGFVALVKDAVKALPKLTKRILEATGNMKPFVKFLRWLGGVVMRVLPDIVGVFMDLGRKALPILKDFIQYLVKNAKPAFDLLMQAAKAIGPELIDLGQAILGLLPDLLKLGTKIANWLIPILTDIVKWVDSLIGKTKKAGPKIDRLKGAFFDLWKTASKLWDTLKPLLADLVPLLKEIAILGLNVAQWALKWSNILAQYLVPILRDAVQWLTDFLRALNTGNYDKALSMIASAVEDLAKAILKWVGKAAEWLWKQLKKGAEKAYDKATEELGKLVDYLQNDFVSDVKSAAKTAGKKLWERLKNFAEAAYLAAEKWLSDLVDYMEDEFVGDVKDAAKDAGEWIWKKLKKMAEKAYDKVKQALEDLIDYIKNDFAGDLKDAIGDAIDNAIPDKITLPEPTLPNVNLSMGGLGGAAIPRFGDGGIVTKPTLGIIGEEGPEAVVPLDDLSTSEGRALPSGGSGGTQEVTVTLDVRGDSPLAKMIARHIHADKQTRDTTIGMSKTSFGSGGA